jgi:hypothetical protein
MFYLNQYTAMIGNNPSQLGVSASQLASGLNTQSFAPNWMPTTSEFDFNETFGDYDYHQKVATRLGAHYTHSREDKKNQPGTNTIENSHVRLTDGSIVFTSDLFGPGIRGDKVNCDMTSVDGGGQAQGPRARGGVLLALAQQLHRHQHRGNRRHRRPRLPGAVLGHGRAQGSPGVPQ